MIGVKAAENQNQSRGVNATILHQNILCSCDLFMLTGSTAELDSFMYIVSYLNWSPRKGKYNLTPAFQWWHRTHSIGTNLYVHKIRPGYLLLQIKGEWWENIILQLNYFSVQILRHGILCVYTYTIVLWMRMLQIISS